MKEENKVICPYCGGTYSKYGIKNHIAITHEKTREAPGTGKISWNKGLTEETDERVRKSSDTLRERYKNGEIHHSWIGRSHTEETKNKISQIRREYLKNNPEKHPYVINHYSKNRSPAESYFEDLFNKENIKYESQVQIHIYILDFVLFDKKIDFEVDGEQHYFDKRIYNSDRKRDKYFELLGWKVIRVRWSDWQKKTRKEKEEFIINLKKE